MGVLRQTKFIDKNNGAPKTAEIGLKKEMSVLR